MLNRTRLKAVSLKIFPKNAENGHLEANFMN